MIALPVLAVTAAAVVQATADVDGVDGIARTHGRRRRRGSSRSDGAVLQAPDPDSGMFIAVEGGGDLPTLADLAEAAGRPRRHHHRRRLCATCRWAIAGSRRSPTEVDLRDPLAEGLFDLRTRRAAGRARRGGHQRGASPSAGSRSATTWTCSASRLTVVGIGRDATYRDASTVDGPPGSFGADFSGEGSAPDWLVGGDPVLWSDVQALNRLGGLRPLARRPRSTRRRSSRWPRRWATTPATATTSRSWR